MLTLLAAFAFPLAVLFFILNVCIIVCFFKINRNVRLMREHLVATKMLRNIFQDPALEYADEGNNYAPRNRPALGYVRTG